MPACGPSRSAGAVARSVLRNHRAAVEQIVDADAHDVVAHPVGERQARNGGRVVDAAAVEIEIFELGGPVPGEGRLRRRRPPPKRCGRPNSSRSPRPAPSSRCARCRRPIRRAVEQQAVGREACPRAHRAERVDAVGFGDVADATVISARTIAGRLPRPAPAPPVCQLKPT